MNDKTSGFNHGKNLLYDIGLIIINIIPPIIGIMGSFLVFNFSTGFSFIDFLKMILVPFLLEESFFYHRDTLIILGTLLSWLGIMTLIFRASYIVPEKLRKPFMLFMVFALLIPLIWVWSIWPYGFFDKALWSVVYLWLNFFVGYYLC